MADNWNQSDIYEQYIGRWSREVAPPFLHWLDLAAGRRWVDVGCGTGALSAAILQHCAPASVTAVEPSGPFREGARQNLAGRAECLAGSATEIPLPEASVDVTVSGLVLNFVANQTAALREMQRVTCKGGVIAAYVWDYAGKMELIRLFWDAAAHIDPAAEPMDEGVRFPICKPDPLRNLFADAGLQNIDVASIDVQTPFGSFEDYWQPFLGGNGPAPAYLMSLDEADRTRLRSRLETTLPIAADGSISLIARAWAIRGTV